MDSLNRYNQVHASTSSRMSSAAGIVGDVTIGEDTSIFAGAQIRGDADSIIIGKRCNIQENAVLHTDPEFPIEIGDDVTIGHGAIIHGCAIQNGVTVGMGSIVMNGAVIGEGSLIAAGALVTQNKAFPSNSLIMGSPAKAVRTLSQDESQELCWKGAEEYLKISDRMVSEGILFNPGSDFSYQIGN